MNPVQSVNDSSDDSYEGSFSLDQALADRFAFIVEVPDWSDMTQEEQDLVIFPPSEGTDLENSFELSQMISTVRPKFIEQIQKSGFT